MVKLLTTAIAFSVFVMAGATGPTTAQTRLCSNAPKNYVPCTVVVHEPKLPKPQSN